jgi:release factor glutamine methyltransferase
MSQVNYQSWVNDAAAKLAACSDSPRLDARLLLCHGLSIQQTRLLSWPDTILSNDDLERLAPLLQQRLDGRPIAYIIGHTEFWGLDLVVSEAVLVPRPETETLVELCLDKAQRLNYPDIQILDLGTGSGAIALALASELPSAHITAVDVSAAALAVAIDNARALRLENVKFVQSSWYEALEPQQFDLIVSNPPYVAEDDPHLESLTYEPDMALTAPNNGMADIQTIIKQAAGYLVDGGFLMLEHGYNQGAQVRDEFNKHGFSCCETIRDLAGNERVTLGRLE